MTEEKKGRQFKGKNWGELPARVTPTLVMPLLIIFITLTYVLPSVIGTVCWASGRARDL